MVHAHSLPARILANVAIWAILVYGSLFLVAFKDYTMGFELTILSAGKSFNYAVVTVSQSWSKTYEAKAMPGFHSLGGYHHVTIDGMY